MIRAIIKIPSTPPIDIAIMDNRGRDEWPGLLDCVEEAVALDCVEEVAASDCAVETVRICVVEIAPPGPITVVVTFKAGEVVCVVRAVRSPSRPVTVVVIFELREVVDLDKLDWVVCVGCGVASGGAIDEAVDPGGYCLSGEYCLSGGQPGPQGSTEQQPVNGGLAQL